MQPRGGLGEVGGGWWVGVCGAASHPSLLPLLRACLHLTPCPLPLAPIHPSRLPCPSWTPSCAASSQRCRCGRLVALGDLWWRAQGCGRAALWLNRWNEDTALPRLLYSSLPDAQPHSFAPPLPGQQTAATATQLPGAGSPGGGRIHLSEPTLEVFLRVLAGNAGLLPSDTLQQFKVVQAAAVQAHPGLAAVVGDASSLEAFAPDIGECSSWQPAGRQCVGGSVCMAAAVGEQVGSTGGEREPVAV